jgi:hypothetical protein
MKRFLSCLFAPVLFGVAGCASLQTPSAESLRSVPVVEFGNAVPATGDFVLHFAAGKPIPVVASVTGNALAQEAESTLNVTLKQDIYAYKQWVSFDRATWIRSDKALGFKLVMKVPSPEHPKPGVLKVQVDRK